MRILPVFSSSVAFQKNLRTPSKKFLGTGRAAADSKLFFRADCAIADSNRRYVRIRFHLRPVFLEKVSESPGHRLSRTSPSIQAALLDSHIDYFCPRGADFREEGVLRSKARAARLPGPGGAIVLSQRHARSFPLAAVPLSRLASAVSIAHNAQPTSRFQLCRSPNENAEVPAAFRNGHFECVLSVGISLAACSVTLMAGSTCVRGVLARRTESSGKPRQIQPVRRCGRAH